MYVDTFVALLNCSSLLNETYDHSNERQNEERLLSSRCLLSYAQPSAVLVFNAKKTDCSTRLTTQTDFRVWLRADVTSPSRTFMENIHITILLVKSSACADSGYQALSHSGHMPRRERRTPHKGLGRVKYVCRILTKVLF